MSTADPAGGPALVAVDPLVAEIVRPAVLTADDLDVREQSDALDRALAEAEARLRQPDAPDLAPAVAAVRAMYRRVGIDPTKTRPSSEALLRRLRRGEHLPRINTLVDVINWCSVERQLPYGLYDRDAITGAVTLRLGRPDESYAGIRKDEVHLGGRLTLADEAGPFGNPTSDSLRTCVTTRTRRALVVIFVPASMPASAGDEAIALTRRRIVEFCRPAG